VEEMGVRVSLGEEAMKQLHQCQMEQTAATTVDDSPATSKIHAFVLTHYDLNVLVTHSRPNFTASAADFPPTSWQNLFGNYLSNHSNGAAEQVLSQFATSFLNWTSGPNVTQIAEEASNHDTASTSPLLSLASHFGISFENLTTIDHQFTSLILSQSFHYSHFTNQSLEIVFKSLSLKESRHLTPYYLFIWNSNWNCSVPQGGLQVHVEYLVNRSSKKAQTLTLAEILSHVGFWTLCGIVLSVVCGIVLGITMLLCLQEAKYPVHKVEESTTHLEELKQDPVLLGFLYFLHVFNFIRDHNVIVSIIYRSKRARHNEIFGSLSRFFSANIVLCVCLGIVIGIQMVQQTTRMSPCTRSFQCHNDMCESYREQFRLNGIEEGSAMWTELEASFACTPIEESLQIGSDVFDAGSLYYLKSHLKTDTVLSATMTGVMQVPAARNDTSAIFSSQFVEKEYFQECLRDFCFAACQYPSSGALANLQSEGAEQSICTATAPPFTETQHRVCKNDSDSCSTYDRFFMDFPYTLLLSCICFAVLYPISQGVMFLTEQFVGKRRMTRVPKLITLLITSVSSGVLSILIITGIVLLLVFTESSSRFVVGMRMLFAFGLLLITLLLGSAILAALFYWITLRWRLMSYHLREELFMARDRKFSNVDTMEEYQITFSMCVDYLDCNGDPSIVEEKIEEIKPTPTLLNVAEYNTWVGDRPQQQESQQKKNKLKSKLERQEIVTKH